MSTSPQHVGKYVLHECLRRNGKIEFWKALDTESKHLVAIKLLHSDLQVNLDFLAHFEREARTLASLHHPNIVHVCDFHISRSPESGSTLAYIVMDYIEGQTLADYIRNTSRMRKFPSASDIVHLFASLSIAIDYAHQYGVIHHNIKPGNILLDQRHSTPNALGEPILTGFSIGSLEHTSTSAVTNAQIDTALYLAPEQARGYVGNELSDIYSLGVILYEICTGVPPFQGDTPTAIKMQHINTMPKSPVLMNPNISPTLTDVILRSLTKDPALRFSSASSMSRALAEAFDVSVPENLFLSSPITDHMNEPTYYKPLLTNMLPGGKQSFPSIEIIKSSSPPPTGLSTLSQQQTALLANRGQSIPITSASSIPAVPFANLSPNMPVTSSSVPPGPTPLPTAKKRPKGLIIALCALLLLVLVGSGLRTLFLLPHGSPVTTSRIVGHAYFESSGKLNKDSTQGINDELLIKLHNVPVPIPGTDYYAWLLSDKSQGYSTPMLLGKMLVQHGEANYLYQSPNNTNLLTSRSRLLVTEENVNVTPANPSPTLSNWRYYAELPQTPDPTDRAHHFSILTYLRYLLSEDPSLKQEDLSGGLAIWLVRNTGKILEWAGSARDNWTAKSPTLLRNQLISILEYLDGQSLVQVDLPPHTHLLVDRRLASIPILGFDAQEQTTPGYLRKISLEVTAIAQRPGATPDKLSLINEINIAIKYVKTWLRKVHDDTEQLIKLTDVQLLLPSSQVTLDEMQTLAFYAYVGLSDPSTGKVQSGVMQIHYDIERLATFDITPYTSK